VLRDIVGGDYPHGLAASGLPERLD
jgi:hypothetical protein